MNNPLNQPKPDDVVLGGRSLPPVTDAVLGGLDRCQLYVSLTVLTAATQKKHLPAWVPKLL